MTTVSKPSQGQNVIVNALAPRTVGRFTFRLFDAYYDPASNPSVPWNLSDGRVLTDAEISAWFPLPTLKTTAGWQQ